MLSCGIRPHIWDIKASKCRGESTHDVIRHRTRNLNYATNLDAQCEARNCDVPDTWCICGVWLRRIVGEWRGGSRLVTTRVNAIKIAKKEVSCMKASLRVTLQMRSEVILVRVVDRVWDVLKQRSGAE